MRVDGVIESVSDLSTIECTSNGLPLGRRKWNSGFRNYMGKHLIFINGSILTYGECSREALTLVGSSIT